MVVPVCSKAQHYKGECGSESLEPHILNIRSEWKWMASFTPWSIYPAEGVVGINWTGDTVDPQNRSRRCEEGKRLWLRTIELQSLSHPLHLCQLRQRPNCPILQVKQTPPYPN